MGCQGGDWPVAIGIDIAPPFNRACTRHGGLPIAVELGSDSSTSGNGGASSVLSRTVPLPFIDDPETSFALHINRQLST